MSNTEPLTLPLSLGKQLAAARERANLDQDEMGALVGKNRSTISRWERDAQVPPFSTVVRWSSLTGWPLELFARAEAPSDGSDDPSGLGITASGWNEDEDVLADVVTLRPTVERAA